MIESYRMSDHKEWAAAGLAENVELDRAEYVNQEQDGFEAFTGEWYYADEDARVIYSGDFGNYHSPGASDYTFAEKYDTMEEFKAALAEWEAKPEYIEEDDGPDEDFYEYEHDHYDYGVESVDFPEE